MKCDKHIAPQQQAKFVAKKSTQPRCECDEPEPTPIELPPAELPLIEEVTTAPPSTYPAAKKRKGQAAPIMLSSVHPDFWVGLKVRVQKSTNGRDELETGIVMKSGNGWVQMKISSGASLAKRAYHLELLDPLPVVTPPEPKASSKSKESKASSPPKDESIAEVKLSVLSTSSEQDTQIEAPKVVPASPASSAGQSSSKRTGRAKRKFLGDDDSSVSHSEILPTRTRPSSAYTDGEGSELSPLLKSERHITQERTIPTRPPRRDPTLRVFSSQEEYYTRGTGVAATAVVQKPKQSIHGTRASTSNLSSKNNKKLGNISYTSTPELKSMNHSHASHTPHITPLSALPPTAYDNTHPHPTPTTDTGTTTTGTGPPKINALLCEIKHSIVTKFVERHQEKIKNRPDLGMWYIKLNNDLIDPIYEKSIARRITDSVVVCKYCMHDKWPKSDFCWNDQCPDSPIYNPPITTDTSINQQSLSNTTPATTTTTATNSTTTGGMSILHPTLSVDSDSPRSQHSLPPLDLPSSLDNNTSTNTTNNSNYNNNKLITSSPRRKMSTSSKSNTPRHSLTTTSSAHTPSGGSLLSPGRRQRAMSGIENNYGYIPAITTETLQYLTADYLPLNMCNPKKEPVIEYILNIPHVIIDGDNARSRDVYEDYIMHPEAEKVLNLNLTDNNESPTYNTLTNDTENKPKLSGKSTDYTYNDDDIVLSYEDEGQYNRRMSTSSSSSSNTVYDISNSNSSNNNNIQVYMDIADTNNDDEDELADEVGVNRGDGRSHIHALSVSP